MELVTQAELSRIAKCSRAAVNQAVKSSRLRKIKGSGKLNLDDKLTKVFIEDTLQNIVKRNPETIQKHNKSNRKPGNNNPNSPDLKLSPDNPDEQLQKLYWDIRKTKESALKVEVERNKARGVLIKRDLVQRVFAKLYTIDSNELKPLGDKLAPEIAAIFESDDPKLILKVNKKIEKEIFRSLGHIKRLMNDFLIKIGTEGIK
jgi:hypothetical protein